MKILKKFRRIYALGLIAVCLFAVGAVLPCGRADASGIGVYLGGMPAGFVLETRGAGVIGLCEVAGEGGNVSPAKEAGIRVGDVLISVCGSEVSSAADIEKSLAGCTGESVPVVYRRGEEETLVFVRPICDFSGKYKLGLFVRDTISGIGTITYIRKDNLRFGALGHPIVGTDGETAAEVRGGNLYRCSVIGVKRGERGTAGELKGIFLRDKIFAVADGSSDAGIFGRIEKDAFDAEKYVETETLGLDGARPGRASIYATAEGTEPKEYSISIVKVDKTARDNKNFVIRITDRELLDKTSGILQGMSGSPIVQNGKLIGAVTHVFLNDPTRGFGIGIENIIKE